MAIMAYTGVMGSGKSYEGVGTAALNALREGRRVVTNISGFNLDAIREYIGPLRDGSMLESEKVVVIPSQRITQANFFFDPEAAAGAAESVVRPGDLVLVDEAWAFWATDSKLSAEHQKFFRMHRHYTEVQSGTACDLVILIQDLSSLHRFIRGVLESTFRFTKLKTLGLSNRYRIECYEGNKQRKGTLVSAAIKRYDKRIFALYKSYDAGTGKESVVDGRQNLFHNKGFVFIMVAALAGLLGAGWWFVAYVHKLQSGGSTVKPGASAPLQAVPASPTAIVERPSSLAGGSDVRLVGLLGHRSGETTAIFQLGDGRIVQQRMSAGVIDGWQSVVGHQGRMVGFYFGSKGK